MMQPLIPLVFFLPFAHISASRVAGRITTSDYLYSLVLYLGFADW
jgi:hypothetical protein